MRASSLCLAVILAGCSSTADVDSGSEGEVGGQPGGSGGTAGAAGKAGAAGGVGTGGAGGAAGTSGDSGTGGSGAMGGAWPAGNGVSIHPKVRAVNPGGQFTFSCWVGGSTDTSCTYKIKETGSGGGPFFSANDKDGQPLPAGTYHVVATSVADPTKTDEATVYVSPIQLQLSTYAIVSPGAQQSFQCQVFGTTDTACDFSVMEGATAGTASRYDKQLQGWDVGTYVAPQTPGLYHVLASSRADPTKASAASVWVRKIAPSDCSNLPPVGQVEEITPPEINLPGPYYEHGTTVCNFGFNTANIDSSGSIFLGTCQFGVWKSSNCGATWTHINKGSDIESDGAALDNGRQWYYLIDPTNEQIHYTGAGYNGGRSGGLRSDDGGVNWKFIWPPPDGSYSGLILANFISVMVMDPTNPSHLLVGFHAPCNSGGTGPYTLADGVTPITDVCIGETLDKGETWTIHNKDPRMNGSEAQNPAFLDSTHWLFSNHDAQSGIWWTTDAGKSWDVMGTDSATHWAQQIYKASTGTWYVPGNRDLFRSTDGGNSWSKTANWKGEVTISFAGNGTNMWATYYGDLNARVPAGTTVYVQSPESDGLTWTPSTFDFTRVPWGGFLEGAQTLSIDRTRKVIYATHGAQGLYRVRYE